MLVPAGQSKPNETCMKNYGTKSEILFDQSLITQTIMQQNLISIAIYLYEKLLERCNVRLVLRSVFHEDNKYYVQVLLDKYLWKLQILIFWLQACFNFILHLAADLQTVVWYYTSKPRELQTYIRTFETFIKADFKI